MIIAVVMGRENQLRGIMLDELANPGPVRMWGAEGQNAVENSLEFVNSRD